MPPKKSQAQRQTTEGDDRATKKRGRNILDEAEGSEDGNISSTKVRRSQRTTRRNGSDDKAGTSKGGKEDTPPAKMRKSKTSQGNSGGAGKETIGSKHDKADAPAQRGSNQRLPKKGQKAYWKAMPGWVDGEVLEIVTTQKNIDGHQVKGTEDEPRIVLKSTKSGKRCIHKPNNCYFDD